MCCLGIVLSRGGLQVTFKGKGLKTLFMSVVPCFVEATAIALVGMGVFQFPIEVSYAMGFAASSVGTAIVASLVLRLNDLGYGR